MNNPGELLPDNMRPVTDPRIIAAELSYTHWLVQITRGLVSEEDEATYKRPFPEDFTPKEAKEILIEFWEWAFDNNNNGILERANFDTTRNLLGRAASLAAQLPGLDIASAKSVYDALNELSGQIGVEYDASRPKFADYGDEDLLKELGTVSIAQRVVRNLVEVSGSSLKELLMSGSLDREWTKIFDKAK